MTSKLVDQSGAEWLVAFSPAALQRIAIAKNCKPDDVMKTVVLPLLTGGEEFGVFDLYNILWCLVQPTAIARNVTRDSFDELVFDNLEEAIEQAVLSFIPKSQRGMTQAALDKATQTIKKAEKMFVDLLDDPQHGIDDKKLNSLILSAVRESQVPPLKENTVNAFSSVQPVVGADLT